MCHEWVAAASFHEAIADYYEPQRSHLLEGNGPGWRGADPARHGEVLNGKVVDAVLRCGTGAD